MDHFADRLTAAVRRKGNAVCAGLDPRWESLPDEIRRRYGGDTLSAVAKAFEEFCFRVIDVVAPLVPAVKPQMAFFEMCGPAGFLALEHVLQRARRNNLITILDGKRNDIASTAAAYADAAFAGTAVGEQRHPVWQADAVTINPYLGRDAVEPFLQSARQCGGGVFVLVRTSNPGAGLFQDLPCSAATQGIGGLTPPARPLYMNVAEEVSKWSRENLGRCGFGDVGAVVGATHPQELAAVRQVLPEAFLLVPGYGAQGAGATDILAAFRTDGLGALVNSSRGIIFPFAPADTDWESRVEKAARATIAELSASTPMGQLSASPPARK